MTVRTQPQPRTQEKNKWVAFAVWITVILSLLTAAAIAGTILVNTMRGPSRWESEVADVQAQSRLEQERAAGKAKVRGAVVRQWFVNLLPVIVTGVALAIALRQLSIIRPDRAGAYPLLLLKRMRMNWPWKGPLLEFWNRLIDPNRNPTVGIELGEEVKFIQPDQVSDVQRQITTQAQVVQAERARALGGPMVLAGGRGGRARSRFGGPEIVVYERPLPQVGTMSVGDSHIERLLIESGDLEPSTIIQQEQGTF
jgi:hypothetical protein